MEERAKAYSTPKKQRPHGYYDEQQLKVAHIHSHVKTMVQNTIFAFVFIFSMLSYIKKCFFGTDHLIGSYLIQIQISKSVKYFAV